MKIAGKTNKLHQDKHPLDRHGFERFGDGFDPDVAQWLGFIKWVNTLCEDTEPEVRLRGNKWWSERILPDLRTHITTAIANGDGAWLRALAYHLEIKEPLDPEREWICRSFKRHVNAKGKTTIATLDGLTFNAIAAAYTKETGRRIGDPHTFRAKLREFRVTFKREPGGRSKKLGK